MQQEISQDNNNCVNTPMWVTYGSGAPADGWDCSAFDEHFCNENIGRCNDEHSGLCIDTGADKNCCACGKGEADAEEQQIASDKTAEEQVQRDLDKAAEQARLKVTEAEAEAAKKAFAAEKAAEEATQMAHAAAVEKGHLRQAQVVADAAQQRALEEAARLAEQKKKSEGADAAAAAAKKQAAEATKESEEADSAVATTRQVDLDTQAQQASQGSGLEGQTTTVTMTAMVSKLIAVTTKTNVSTRLIGSHMGWVLRAKGGTAVHSKIASARISGTAYSSAHCLEQPRNAVPATKHSRRQLRL